MRTFLFGLVFVSAIYFSEAKSLDGARVLAKRDVLSQAELILKVAELLLKSQTARDLLEKEGKPLLAAGIKKVEDVLKDLDTKVRSANPSTELGKLALKGLDELIVKAEELLETELKKIEDSDKPISVYKRDLKSQEELLLKLAELLLKSQTARDLLEKEGKPLLAAGIKKVEDVLKDLDTKVRSENPKTELGKLALKGLDALIVEAEDLLEKELKKIEDSDKPISVYKRDLKSQEELLLKLAELLLKSQTARDLLEKEGKPLLAAGIKKVEDVLNDLDTKVRSANPSTELGKLALKGLDALIVEAEDLLEKELKKIEDSKSIVKRDVSKDGLLKSADELLQKAKDVIDFLKSQGKSVEATELELLETVVLDVEQRLQTLDPKTEIGKLLLDSVEGLLKKAETDLSAALDKLKANP